MGRDREAQTGSGEALGAKPSSSDSSAALAALANGRTSDALATGTALPNALVDGFHAAFWGGAGVAVVGIVAALTLIKSEKLEAAPEEVVIEPIAA